MLALGLTPFLCKILYDVTGQTPAIPIGERFQWAPLYLCWIMVGVCWLWVKSGGYVPGFGDTLPANIPRRSMRRASG